MINTKHDEKKKETLKSKCRHYRLLKRKHSLVSQFKFFHIIKEFHKDKCNLLKVHECSPVEKLEAKEHRCNFHMKRIY